MARQTKNSNLAPVLSAATRWIDECLIKDGSLFSDELLWTAERVEEVRRAFVEHPDIGKEDFITKLRGQMSGAPPGAQQLMAEMSWALLLFPSNINEGTKRKQIREVWALSNQPMQDKFALLTDPVLAGIGSGGPGFNNHRWREIVFLISIAADLKARDEIERTGLLKDYDAFTSWIATVPQKGHRQFRHMLRFFAFPEKVERMSDVTPNASPIIVSAR